MKVMTAEEEVLMSKAIALLRVGNLGSNPPLLLLVSTPPLLASVISPVKSRLEHCDL